MIRGYITDSGAPLVDVTVAGIRRQAVIPALVDTGFDGDLSLPIGIAVGLGLELVLSITIDLGDGTIKENELVFAGMARLGDGKPRRVEILLTTSQEALVGRSWFREGSLSMNFKTGELAIEEVPSEADYR